MTPENENGQAPTGPPAPSTTTERDQYSTDAGHDAAPAPNPDGLDGRRALAGRYLNHPPERYLGYSARELDNIETVAAMPTAEDDTQFQVKLSNRVEVLRVNAEAARILAAERAHTAPRVEVVNGATFILDRPPTAAALWGSGSDILWADGEGVMIAGGMGLGKTTLAILLVRAQLGLIDQVLGLPVTDSGGKILYLAMDRPHQIARAAARQFTEADRDILTDRLIMRPGPPPVDLATDTDALAKLADEHDAEIVYVDSLKDAAVGLSEDAVGAGYNRARQKLLAEGRQICDLHHNVKRGPNGQAPSGVADVFGSTWLTSGAGSVIMLTGEPGDPLVQFRHVKQPANEVGPWTLQIDHDGGNVTVDPAVDLVALATAGGAEGVTAKVVATVLVDTGKPPTRSEVEKARRKLDRLVDIGRLVIMEGMKGGGSHRVESAYFPGPLP